MICCAKQPMKAFLSKVRDLGAQRLYRRANDAFLLEQRYGHALALTNQLLAQHPDHLNGLILKADILFCLRRDHQALATLDHVLSIAPGTLEAHMSRISVLDVLGRRREALAECNLALMNVGPADNHLLPILYDLKLSLLVGLGKLRQARRMLADVVNRVSTGEREYFLATYQPQLPSINRTTQPIVSQNAMPRRVLASPTEAAPSVKALVTKTAAQPCRLRLVSGSAATPAS